MQHSSEEIRENLLIFWFELDVKLCELNSVRLFCNLRGSFVKTKTICPNCPSSSSVSSVQDENRRNNFFMFHLQVLCPLDICHRCSFEGEPPRIKKIPAHENRVDDRTAREQIISVAVYRYAMYIQPFTRVKLYAQLFIQITEIMKTLRGFST